MIALAAALLLQATQPNPFAALVPAQNREQPPCISGAVACYPWERRWPTRWLAFASDNGSIYYYDTHTVVRSAYEVRFWVTINHRYDRSERARSTRGLMVITCTDRKYRWESLIAFDPAGNPMPRRWSRSSYADNIPPESPAETLWRWGCTLTDDQMRELERRGIAR